MVEAPLNSAWGERLALAQELCNAVIGRKFRRVHELLQSGADMNIRNENGMTALMLATYRKDRRMVELFRQHEAGLAYAND